MSGLNALMFALALVLWMEARITNSSQSVTLEASTIVTSSSSGSASVNVKAPENVTTSHVHATSTSVTVKAPENVTTSHVHATSASVTVKAPKKVTTSHVHATSASVIVKAPENVTTSHVHATSASVIVKAPENVTTSHVHATSASVIVKVPENVTTSHVHATLTSVIVKAPENVTTSHVHATSTSVIASPNATKSLSLAAVSATTSTSQLVSKFSAPGQTSRMSMIPSSVVAMPSPSVSQSTQVGTSMLAHSFSKETVSVMTHLVGSLTVAASKSSLTSSPPINTTSASSPATPTTAQPTAQPTAPTLPPGGTKFVSMEVSFNIAFKEEYSDTESPEYKELKDNLTTSLEKVYKNVDGFVGVRILFITKGSVVCSYIVILAKDSKVTPSELKEKLQEASDAGELSRVTSIKVEEDESEETEEKLPKWALVVMIVLGCLSAVFLVIVIYVCVKHRRSLYGRNEAYLVSTGEIGLAHAYDRVSIGDNKKEANQGTAQKPGACRRVVGSHTNPTYGSNGALAD